MLKKGRGKKEYPPTLRAFLLPDLHPAFRESFCYFCNVDDSLLEWRKMSRESMPGWGWAVGVGGSRQRIVQMVDKK